MSRRWNLTQYDEGLRTLKTVVTSIFSKIFPEADERTSYRFPEFLMFDTFFKIGYYTFIIPFKISKDAEGIYHVTTNIVQQIISTIIVLCTAIHSLFSIRLLFKMDLKSNPSEAFAVIYGMMKHCFPTIWFYTFWICRNNFAKLLLVCQANSSSPSMYFARCISSPFMPPPTETIRRKDKFNPEPRNSVEWKLAILCRLVVLFGASKILIETGKLYMASPSNEEFFWRILNFNGGAAPYNYRVVEKYIELDKGDNKTINGWIENWKENYLNLMFLVSHCIFGAFYDYMGNLVDVLCFIGAAIIFSICERFSKEIPKIKEDNDGTTTNPLFLEEQSQSENRPSRLTKILEKMSVDFMELCNVEEAANGIFGPTFLLYILGAFPSLAGFMVFKQKNSITGDNFGQLSVIYGVLMHSLTSMIASEGSSKITEYKCWLFDVSLLRTKRNEWSSRLSRSPERPVPALSNAVLSRLNHLHREASSSAIGLKGSCGFFTMTHGLIGTMLGIFVTFAIVIVQFEMDAPKKDT